MPYCCKSPTGRRATDMTHGFANLAEYAFARRAELHAALEAGRAYGVRTEFAGVTDQEACLNFVPPTEHILRLLREDAPVAISTQPHEGGHPDHDAVAFAVSAAGRLIASEGRSPLAIIEMTAYRVDGTRLSTGTFLPSECPVTTIELGSADRLRKRRMIDCFTSQHGLLAGFATAVERFRETPNYDFLQPPHPGELHYEKLGWGITGELWRRHARTALAALGLRSPPWV
jgi:LmbE family N-acetylglucosaminyl deacetylase